MPPRPRKTLTYVALAAAWLFVLVVSAHGGDPQYVAGAGYFDPSTKGTPLVWAQGTVHYYTDQGDLSPLLPGPAADAPPAPVPHTNHNLSRRGCI